MQMRRLCVPGISAAGDLLTPRNPITDLDPHRSRLKVTELGVLGWCVFEDDEITCLVLRLVERRQVGGPIPRPDHLPIRRSQHRPAKTGKVGQTATLSLRDRLVQSFGGNEIERIGRIADVCLPAVDPLYDTPDPRERQRQLHRLGRRGGQRNGPRPWLGPGLGVALVVSRTVSLAGSLTVSRTGSLTIWLTGSLAVLLAVSTEARSLAKGQADARQQERSPKTRASDAFDVWHDLALG